MQRAVNIARGDELPLETWKRVKSYFDRHQGDKDAKGSPSRGYWGDDSNPSAGYVAWLLWGSDAGWEQARQVLKAKNPGGRVMGLFDKIRGKRKQTFEEACYQRKPPGLRPRQTVVVDNEGRYFLVSENTPEAQRQLGYREVLVFPSDSSGNVYEWTKVGGRRGVDFVTFLTDLLEGRETLHEPLHRESAMRHNPGQSRRTKEDGMSFRLTNKDRQAVREGYLYAVLHNGKRVAYTPTIKQALDAHLGEGYSIIPIGDMVNDPLASMLKAPPRRSRGKRNPAYSIFDDLPDYEVELPRRSRSSYSGPDRGAFELRSEDGRTASFSTKREAEEWADDYLPSGCYFTITSRATDTLYEYEKE